MNLILIKSFNSVGIKYVKKGSRVTFSIYTQMCILLKYKIYSISREYIFYKCINLICMDMYFIMIYKNYDRIHLKIVYIYRRR